MGHNQVFYFSEWQNKQKTICVAEYIPKSLLAVGSLAAFSGMYLLNTIYGGAGTYQELALLPLIFGYSN